MPDPEWVSVHAFYQDPLDFLVTGVVAPLVGELAAAGLSGESFFLRYWDGGPHLRLRVRPAPGADPAEIRRLVGRRFRDYLSRRPSPDRMSAHEYARFARQAAIGENVQSWAPHQQPNNSIAFIAYRPEHDRYGRGASMAVVERHFVESSRIALRVVTVTEPPARAAVAITLILIAWFVGDPDPGRVAAWAARRGAGSAQRAGADPKNLDTAIGFARSARTLAGAALDLPGTGTLVDWARSLLRLRAALQAQVAAGASAPGWGGSLRTADNGVRSVLDLCAHLICNRLGMSPPVEATLRSLAVEAVRSLAEEGS